MGRSENSLQTDNYLKATFPFFFRFTKSLLKKNGCSSSSYHSPKNSTRFSQAPNHQETPCRPPPQKGSTQIRPRNQSSSIPRHQGKSQDHRSNQSKSILKSNIFKPF